MREGWGGRGRVREGEGRAGGEGESHLELIDRDFARIIAVYATKHLGEHFLVGVNGRDVTVGALAPVDGNAVCKEAAAVDLCAMCVCVCVCVCVCHTHSLFRFLSFSLSLSCSLCGCGCLCVCACVCIYACVCACLLLWLRVCSRACVRERVKERVCAREGERARARESARAREGGRERLCVACLCVHVCTVPPRCMHQHAHAYIRHAHTCMNSIMVFGIVRIEGIEGTVKPLIGLLTLQSLPRLV